MRLSLLFKLTFHVIWNSISKFCGEGKLLPNTEHKTKLIIILACQTNAEKGTAEKPTVGVFSVQTLVKTPKLLKYTKMLYKALMPWDSFYGV